MRIKTKKPIPEEMAAELLSRSVERNDETVMVDIGEASRILKEGTFNDYCAYRSFCADAGTVTFGTQQLLRDAGYLPGHPEAESVISEGRISENGKYLG